MIITYHLYSRLNSFDFLIIFLHHHHKKVVIKCYVATEKVNFYSAEDFF